MTKHHSKKPIAWHRLLLLILGGFIGLVVILAVGVAAYHHIATAIEKSRNPAPGRLVEAEGRMIHVFISGQGETSFVLLSGGGIGAPVLEYKPLWSRLAEHGRVAVVEYLGYGWSDDTDAPRSAAAIVRELRTALAGAGFEPPYTLVAHSIGGLYAMSYAQSFPDELAALIALDTTLPKAIIEAKARGETLPRFDTLSLLRKTGLLRILLGLNPLLVSGAPKGVYNEQEARAIAMVTNWGYAGKALVNEFLELESNMMALIDASFPSNLPVLFIQADPPDKDTEIAAWSLAERRRLIQNLDRGKVVELPAGHSGLYWYLSDEIVKETLAFIGQIASP